MITYQSHGSFLSLQMLVSLNQGCTIQTDMQTRHPTHKIKFKERGVCVEHPATMLAHLTLGPPTPSKAPETLGFGGGAAHHRTARAGHSRAAAPCGV